MSIHSDAEKRTQLVSQLEKDMDAYLESVRMWKKRWELEMTSNLALAKVLIHKPSTSN